MKTRTKKGTSSQKATDEQPVSKIQQLGPSVSETPKVLILPKDASAAARIVTLPNPATSTPSRYLLCPDLGFYEFTRVVAPKADCRSWLLAPSQMNSGDVKAVDDAVSESEAAHEGYVLRSPEMMITTAIDPLFMIMPALTQVDQNTSGMQMFLSLSDYINRLEERSPHFRKMVRDDSASGSRLEGILESRMKAVCDELDTGDEKLYKLSDGKLLDVLLKKATAMVERGLPASLEERFVKQPLVVPMMSVKREESGMSFGSNGDFDDALNGTSQDVTTWTSTSQDTQSSSITTTSVLTAATSTTPTPDEELSAPSAETQRLLRLRTALNFLLASYIAPPLRQTLNDLLAVSDATIDFKPLDKHLAHMEKLKQEAQTLRSLSENISRKRGLEDDDEALEKAEAKKRKKEEEEFKKKNMSRGVQQLKKADTSGMKKLSSFFGKAAAKK